MLQIGQDQEISLSAGRFTTMLIPCLIMDGVLLFASQLLLLASIDMGCPFGPGI